jgi:phosphohistidine phosphatase
MKLYILRHGESPAAADAGVARDFDRPLSEQGRRDARRAARLLAERGAKPELILHSPLVRAAQTAEEAAGVLKPVGGLEAFPPLANALSAEALSQELRRRSQDLGEIMAVGHQPQLGELVESLSQAVFNLRPAGLAVLELKDEGPASFLWACNPEDLPVP